MERAYKKFLEVGKTKGLFSLDDPEQSKVVVISAHSLQHAVLRFLVKDVEGTSKKKTPCKMNEEPTAKINGSSLQEGYECSKCHWEYKDIFSFPDAWFLSIINYPTSTHWMLIERFTQDAKSSSSTTHRKVLRKNHGHIQLRNIG